MKVTVHRCSNRKFWYASYIGRELEVVEHSAVAYKLTDTSPNFQGTKVQKNIYKNRRNK